MDRRQFLATATAAGALPLAGCSTLGVGTTTLHPVGQETEARETHLLFGRDGRRLLTYTIRHGLVESEGAIPLRLSVWHAEETHLDSLRIEVRAPTDGGDPPTPVYLRSPWPDSGPDLDFHQSDDYRATVITVEDLGKMGDGTVSLELLLDPIEAPETLPVGVRGEFEFSETGLLGQSYRADGRATVEVGSDRER